MGAQFSQFFPPKPTWTEAKVGSLDGKVFIVTGGASGIGFELAKMLFEKGGKVYIAGRSKEKAQKAVEEIQAAIPNGGSLEFLHLVLDDLSTIKASAEEFMEKESRLDVLWNNAGVSQPPLGSLSKQGIELQLATNCLGPFLFTQLLLPLLETTAATSTPGSVRVIWTGSQIVELSAPQGGIIMSELATPPKDQTRTYVTSKAGNMFLASELARRVGPSHNIISVSLNPGAANTNLLRHSPWMKFLAMPLLYKPKLAAITELFAGLSSDVNLEENGCYIIPWGRISRSVRQDLVDASKSTEDGGTGRSQEFWEFCERKTTDYM
ncbi:Peptidase M16 inactive domain family protein [Trichophyton interdigitale]|uniref:Peptidase M16 inactive domain family protein n=1 Tax=Trichophyton interdigitale TaxID=101480 RepID=A0A9P5CYZ7_9EURO|nr:Peptidase M16 inactive domain family protein [Trichophyton interdigitale]KAF3895670.1 Peptidase M16 inactive domain family protein [Trichophyton interdigitale]KAG8208681.1 Peptidase M16 inactive domain family protein [Trichophyton interdigitale]